MTQSSITLTDQRGQPRLPAMSLYHPGQPLGTTPAQVIQDGPAGEVRRAAKAALEAAPTGSLLYRVGSVATQGLALASSGTPSLAVPTCSSTQDTPGGVWTQRTWTMEQDGMVRCTETTHDRLQGCVNLRPAPHAGHGDLRSWATGLPETYAGIPVRYARSAADIHTDGPYPFISVGHHDNRTHYNGDVRPTVLVGLITDDQGREEALTLIPDILRHDPAARNRMGTLGASSDVPDLPGILAAIAAAAAAAQVARN